jgi:Protein of unknown function (DUF1460)
MQKIISIVLLAAGSLVQCQTPTLSPTVATGPVASQPVIDYTAQDSLLALQKMALTNAEQRRTGRVLAVAKSCLGTPYEGGVLDRPLTERLVVNLRGLDCWTFVEAALALALTAEDTLAVPGFERFCAELRQLRYHNGRVNGYGSRIHYFSGWVLQAQQRGVLRDITAELPGSTPCQKSIRYITEHLTSYPRAEADSTQRALRAGQALIDAQTWHFIPKQKVAAVEALLQEGDIVQCTSIDPHLDVEHQGFAVRRNGRMHLLHASSVGRHQVLISDLPISGYLARVPRMSGIMVARIVEPIR